MKTVQIDGVEVKYEIVSIAYNDLFKFQIDGKNYEVFLEALSEVRRPYRGGYFIYINEMLERFDVQPSHLELIKKALLQNFQEDTFILDFR